ncbi:Aste57867_12658 [Aphanomyces stellatus]|uniref:Aste57867_12658 protein n=1 Tax=Aphanomyces stellatus TaxID=120398 RepID=A0A485KWY6_9STRA|nr:hypothetical protein As57867_012612 [Aphanomyces stellatus]VFT89508.1 Aste57867_12658 [Aphanomyces stellatus]
MGNNPLFKIVREELPTRHYSNTGRVIAPYFLGPLANYIGCNESSSRPPILYVLDVDAVFPFDSLPASNDSTRVGLAYSFTDDNQHDEFGLHSRFCLMCSWPLPKRLSFSCSRLPHATWLLTCFRCAPSMPLSDTIRAYANKSIWNCIFLLEPSTLMKSISVRITWNVDGVTFLMDTARASDATVMVTLMPINYEPEYSGFQKS